MARPSCRPVHIVRPGPAAAAIGCALLTAACSGDPYTPSNQVAVVRTRPAAITRSPAPVAARPVAVATPVYVPYPTRPRRAFVDPPLRPELIDPPGLIPLPPPPSREALAAGPAEARHRSRPDVGPFEGGTLP